MIGDGGTTYILHFFVAHEGHVKVELFLARLRDVKSNSLTTSLGVNASLFLFGSSQTCFCKAMHSTTRRTKFNQSSLQGKQFTERLQKSTLTYTPIADFLSMRVKIIDFGDLHTGTQPIAHGSTAFVYPAIYKNQTPVAVKTFIADELTLEGISHFFRKSLLCADMRHPNIVAAGNMSEFFKGDKKG